MFRFCNHSAIALAGALALMTAAPQAAAVEIGQDVGDVARAKGFAVARPADGWVGRGLSGGSDVLFRDEIATGTRTRVEIGLIDGSQLTLGDDSRLLIDEMVYDPGTRGEAVIRLTEGVFRMVSGEVNKVPGGSLTVRTPLAVIGVRGTDFWGQQTSEKLTVALLDDGELTVSTAAGSVTLTEPGTAVVVEAQDVPPAGPVTLSQETLEAARRTVAW